MDIDQINQTDLKNQNFSTGPNQIELSNNFKQEQQNNVEIDNQMDSQNNQVIISEPFNLYIYIRDLIKCLIMIVYLSGFYECCYLVFSIGGGPTSFFDGLDSLMCFIGFFVLLPATIFTPSCCMTQNYKCCCKLICCRFIQKKLLNLEDIKLEVILPVFLVAQGITPLKFVKLYSILFGIAVLFQLLHRFGNNLQKSRIMVQALFLNGLIRCLFGSLNGLLWNFEGFIPISFLYIVFHYVVVKFVKQNEQYQSLISNQKNQIDVNRIVDINQDDNIACLFFSAIVNLIVYLYANPFLIVRGILNNVSQNIYAQIMNILIFQFIGTIMYLMSQKMFESWQKSSYYILLFISCYLISIVIYILVNGLTSLVFAVVIYMMLPYWIALASKILMEVSQKNEFIVRLSSYMTFQILLQFLFWLSWFPEVKGLYIYIMILQICLCVFYLKSKCSNFLPHTDKREILVFSAISIILFVGFVIQIYSRQPNIIKTISNTQPFKVMTYNVQRGFKLNGYGLNVKGISEIIKENNVDIVGFQESEALHPITGHRDYLYLMGLLTGWQTFYGNNPLNSVFDGTGMMSQFEIILSNAFNLENTPIWPQFSTSIMKVQLTADANSKLTIINCHPALVPNQLNKAHINFIIELINQNSDPIIVLGDFNSPPTDSRFDGMMALGFKHVMNPNNIQNFVYPATRKLSQNSIDSIYYRGLTLISGSGQVIANENTYSYSDHQPMIASFTLT